jgi:chromosome segregation ATPase
VLTGAQLTQTRLAKDDRAEELRLARDSSTRMLEENAKLLAEVARHTDKIEELGRLLQTSENCLDALEKQRDDALTRLSQTQKVCVWFA